MTVKAEKLARDLIALRLKYGEGDFAQALEMIESGELFEQLLEAAHRTRTQISRARPRTKVREKLIAKEAEASRARALAAGDKSLESFLERFLARESLASAASARAFAEILGLRLPTKPPARDQLAVRLVSELAQLSAENRQSLIEQADRLDNPESSLQLWSNVIVKRGAPNKAIDD